MLQAIHDTIIVKPIYEESKSIIIIPKTAEQWKQYHGAIYGEVVSIGPRYPYARDIKPGDKAIFQRHEGKRFIFQGEKYLKLKEKWVHGKGN
jgi:co-chaperonin GroES (HSP10)